MEYIKEPSENITFSQHVLERYTERIYGKTGLEMKQFIATNDEQIKKEILKLYEYSELFWYGKIKDHNFTYFMINRDGWLIIIDKNKTHLITIYRVDLELGNEFNKQYIEKMKDYVENELNEIEEAKNKYDDFIKENDTKTEMLKSEIKTLRQEIQHKENEMKLLEDEKKIELESINLKEKQLNQKIEKFIGAKIYE